MKKKFLILLLLLVAPLVTFANFVDDISGLLDHFFGDNATENTVTIPPIEIPENPNEEDLQNFENNILSEQKKLEEYSSQVSASENLLWGIRDEKRSIREELSLLDQEIGIKTESLEKLRIQSEKWKQELEKQTENESEMSAILSFKQNELSKNIVNQIIRSENLGQDEIDLVLKWIFSDKTISQILEENEIQAKQNYQQTATVNNLETAQKNLSQKEQRAALLFHAIEDLETTLATEKRIIDDMAQGKANLIARLEYNEGQNQIELENYERQQHEAELTIQGLTAGRDTIQEKLLSGSGSLSGTGSTKEQSNPLSFLTFPLKTEMKIEAGFHDVQYKKEFGEDHDGVDFFAPQGTDIFAPADGIVQKTANNGYGYSYLVIDHGNDVYTVYGHVSEILVNEGQEIKQGYLIAKTGGTPGLKGSGYFTSGPHLHFGVFTGGAFVDPLPYLK